MLSLTQALHVSRNNIANDPPSSDIQWDYIFGRRRATMKTLNVIWAPEKKMTFTSAVLGWQRTSQGQVPESISGENLI